MKSSVLVKGMEMPASCIACRFGKETNYVGDFEEKCLVNGKCGYVSVKKPRLDTCPLIEITSQGRLVDADAHILEIRKRYCEDCSRRKGIKNGKMKFLYEIGGVVCRACEIEDMLNALDDAPTVIEAEGREE